MYHVRYVVRAIIQQVVLLHARSVQVVTINQIQVLQTVFHVKQVIINHVLVNLELALHVQSVNISQRLVLLLVCRVQQVIIVI